jgi:hypothetical protein
MFQLDYLKSVSVDVWCFCIELKICEFQSLVTQSLPSLSFIGPRVPTLLLHLLGGLRHLTASGLCTSGRDIAAVETSGAVGKHRTAYGR